MNNYVIRYLWTSSRKTWWYHIRISDKESYSTPQITDPDVKRMAAEKVKKTVSLIEETRRRSGYVDELVFEIIDIRTHKVVSLRELEFILQSDLNEGISRFELIDFD